MKTILLLASILTLTFSCITDYANPSDSVEGIYTGVFERDDATSNVQLNLDNGTFSGTSSVNKFPAICNGAYTVTANSIEFNNSCAWTADFDWTLILSDNWSYTLSNNMLVLTNSINDRYTLIKE